MFVSPEAATRDLERLLANGRLTLMPRRPSDQRLLAALAAAHVEAGAPLTEEAVNERLERWIEGISEPYGIDHVSMRRLMVDLQYLTRTKSGSLYERNPEKERELAALHAVDPQAILAAVREQRQERKRRAAG